jgi:hypothetical protein
VGKLAAVKDNNKLLKRSGSSLHGRFSKHALYFFELILQDG